MEMPLRWGADGVYQDGKSKITCQSYNLHEHSTNQLEIYQTRWHPNSPTDSHLLILMSDNSIRIYDESTLKHSWRVGPIPNNTAVEKNLSYLQCLGDTAVDFDIAPPKVREETPGFNETSDLDNINNSLNSLSIASKRHLKEQQKKIEWPIIVLRGNGTIFVLNAGLNTPQPRIQGPLTVTPALKGNYGDDSCSLLVIPTLPATIVIAENTGIVHHALLIESSNEDCTLNETKLLRNDYDLHVLESVQLELGLSDDKNAEPTSSQIFLKRDPINEQRYFCYHQTGLHGVIIGFVQQLQSYIEGDEEPNMNVKSRAEYILSTKAFSNSKINAVAGIGLLQSPSGIFAILSSGQVISMDIIKLTLSSIPELSSASTGNNGEQKVMDKKISFDQHVKALLHSSVTQPILKLDKTKPPTSQQSFELLMNTIQVIRENQFQRHDQVRQEIAKRAKILEFMKNQQKDDIAQLNDEKDAIQDKAYKLADTHEDIMEKQQALQKRVQDILRLVLLRLPSGNIHEKDFTVQIKNIKTKTDKLLQDVKQIKAKHEIQKKQLDLIELNNDSIATLPQKQEETIKDVLVNMTCQISNLTTTVKNISAITEL